jgi:hypothetical protein
MSKRTELQLEMDPDTIEGMADEIERLNHECTESMTEIAELRAINEELLEACRWAADLMQFDFEGYPALEKCRAAIAKAEAKP